MFFNPIVRILKQLCWEQRVQLQKFLDGPLLRNTIQLERNMWLVCDDRHHSRPPGEHVCTTSTQYHVHSDHTEIELMSDFVSTVTRQAYHLRLMVDCFLSFWDRIKKCQCSLLQEER